MLILKGYIGYPEITGITNNMSAIAIDGKDLYTELNDSDVNILPNYQRLKAVLTEHPKIILSTVRAYEGISNYLKNTHSIHITAANYTELIEQLDKLEGSMYIMPVQYIGLDNYCYSFFLIPTENNILPVEISTKLRCFLIDTILKDI